MLSEPRNGQSTGCYGAFNGADFPPGSGIACSQLAIAGSDAPSAAVRIPSNPPSHLPQTPHLVQLNEPASKDARTAPHFLPHSAPLTGFDAIHIIGSYHGKNIGEAGDCAHLHDR